MILRPLLPTSSALRHLPRHSYQHLHTPNTRSFHPTSSHPSPPPDDHYTTLGVPPTISPTDLKKRFYILSRETHPDLHPNDPAANSRFQAISSSYSVLANPEKRKQYDRDVMGPRRARDTRAPGNEGRGGTYAGSRPASGLSKRRTAFKGPPPSYFGGRDGTRSGSGDGGSAQWREGSYGPTSSFAQAAAGEFDSSKVYKTQTIEDERRDRRREAAAQAAIREMEQESDFWVRFVVVTVVIVGGVSIGGLLVSMFDRPPGGGMVRGDGTLRSRTGDARGRNGGKG